MNDTKKTLTILFVLTTAVIFGQDKYIDPTGTYILGSISDDEKKQKYYSEVRVSSLDKKRIVVTLFILRGAPSFNNGSFIDTLAYDNNRSTYDHPKQTPTCKINLIFSKSFLVLRTENNLDECDFGAGVIADGKLKKTSSKRPIIKDLATD